MKALPGHRKIGRGACRSTGVDGVGTPVHSSGTRFTLANTGGGPRDGTPPPTARPSRMYPFPSASSSASGVIHRTGSKHEAEARHRVEGSQFIFAHEHVEVSPIEVPPLESHYPAGLSQATYAVRRRHGPATRGGDTRRERTRGHPRTPWSPYSTHQNLISPLPSVVAARKAESFSARRQGGGGGWLGRGARIRGRDPGGRGGERARLRAAAGLVLVHACKQLNFTLPIDSFSATAKNMLSESTPQ